LLSLCFYNKNYQKPYSNHAGNSNFSGLSNGSLQETLKSFMDSQTEQNNILVKITENHDSMLGKLSNQSVSLRNDVKSLQERTKTVEAQLGKITESLR
jgi:D-arabinose 5-phosphate isomerase GutQ